MKKSFKRGDKLTYQEYLFLTTLYSLNYLKVLSIEMDLA